MATFAVNNVATNYLAGRRNAQDEQYADRRNVLAEQSIQQNQQEMDMRARGLLPEQQKLAAEQQKQLATRLMQAAEYGLQSPTPKAFIEQNFPEIAQAAGDKWRLSGDEEVKRELEGVRARFGSAAGIGPPKIDQKFSIPQEYVGPDGKPGVFQIGPDGQPRQVQGISPYNRPKGAGISMTMPDGTEVQIGGDGVPNYGGVGLTKPNQTKMQEAFLNAQGNAYALREQMAKYRDEFSTLGGRAKAGIAAGKEFIGMENAPQQTQYLADYTSWKADTLSLLSQYLNQLSGAAISPHEEVRLKGGFPNADDGPTQYKAKAEATMRRFALVQARTAYLLSNPAQSLDSVSLDGMSNIIAMEANKLAKALEKGGMDRAQAEEQAKIKTRQRFGMDN